MSKQQVAWCVKRRWEHKKCIDMGKGNSCFSCGPGASQDQSCIERAPMLSSGGCESIVYRRVTRETLQLFVGCEYESVHVKATIPTDNNTDPDPICRDIPINGPFNKQNISLVQRFNKIVDDIFVPSIVGNTERDRQLIAHACRGVGYCKLLIMGKRAEFESNSALQPDFIWFVIQQIDVLLEKSLYEVRHNSIMDEESSPQLVVWYYALSKLKTSMELVNNSRSAKLFGNDKLFQHVLSWVVQVRKELSNRWMTACKQHGDFYKSFITPHEKIAKIVLNFMMDFDISMEVLLPAQPSESDSNAEFHPSGSPAIWSPTQRILLPAGERRENLHGNVLNLLLSPRLIACNEFGVNMTSLAMGSHNQPLFDFVEQRYIYTDGKSHNLMPYYDPGQHLDISQDSQNKHNFLPTEYPNHVLTRNNEMSASEIHNFLGQGWKPPTMLDQYQHMPTENQEWLPHNNYKPTGTNVLSDGTQFSQQFIQTFAHPQPQQPPINNSSTGFQPECGYPHTFAEDTTASPVCTEVEDFFDGMINQDLFL